MICTNKKKEKFKEKDIQLCVQNKMRKLIKLADNLLVCSEAILKRNNKAAALQL
jgi:hypothetical protein